MECGILIVLCGNDWILCILVIIKHGEFNFSGNVMDPLCMGTNIDHPLDRQAHHNRIHFYIE